METLCDFVVFYSLIPLMLYEYSISKNISISVRNDKVTAQALQEIQGK